MPAEPKLRAAAAKQGAVLVGLAVRAHRCGTNERDFQILNNVILVRWLRAAIAHTPGPRRSGAGSGNGPPTSSPARDPPTRWVRGADG